MKRIGIFLLSAFLVLGISVNTVSAQIGSQNQIIRAVAGKDRNVKVGRDMVFDASDSYIPNGITPVYKWDMGNENFRFGLRPIFSYDIPGVYKVKLTVEAKDGTSMSVDEAVVEVFEEQAVVIARLSDIPETELQDLVEIIKSNNVAVKVVYLKDNFPSEFIERRILKNELLSISYILKDADIIVAIDRFSIETLIDYSQTFPEDIKNKKVQYLLTPGAYEKTSINLAQFFSNVTHAEEVSLHYIENLPSTFFQKGPTLNPLFKAEQSAPRPHFSFVDFFYQFNSRLIALGISIDVLYMLYMVIFITVFSLALRKIVGISAIGMHTLALTFLAMISIGFMPSFIVFTLFTAAHYVVRRVYRTDSMSLFPSHFINGILVVILTVVGVFFIRKMYSDFPIDIHIMLAFIIIAISANRLSLSMVGSKFHMIFLKYAQEILFFSLNMLLFTSESFRMVILMYPEVYIFVVIVCAIGLEKYTGLRLSEVIRFKGLIKDREE